jgi:GNAT superfamily N-acetyltransferase
VTRRVRPLDGEAVEHLPGRCRACLFWELGRPRPDAATMHHEGDELAGDPVVAKQAWCTSQVLAGRPPGRIVRIDDELAGYALFGPVSQFARRRAPVPAASRDALLLATLWVEPAHRKRGVGRLLVQAAIKEALRLGLTAVEAYGDRRWRESDCVLPVTWLLHEGFEVTSEHPRYPLLRIDAKRTARWTEALEHAVEEVLERIPRRHPSPAPAPDGGVGMPVPAPESRRLDGGDRRDGV